MRFTLPSPVAARARGAAGSAAATVAATLLFLVVAPGGARADSFVSGGLETKEVRITRVEGETVFYKTRNDADSFKTINDKFKLAAQDEPNLNAAEDAYVTGKFADAVDGYMKALRSSTKPWVKDYAALRLLKAADKSNRFDAAVAAWIIRVQKDPKSATAVKPALPGDSGSSYLKSAETMLRAAIDSEKDNIKSAALAAFLSDVLGAMGKKEEASKVLTSVGTAASPEARVPLSLAKARAAVEAKDFKAAQAALDGVRADVSQPADMADWLWLSAETRNGLAGGGAAAAAADASAWRDVALDYMRLASSFPSDARVPQALLQTARILEQKLNDKKAALSLYQEVATTYPQSAVGNDARKELERLKNP